MANLRKVAETLAAHGQHDLAREVAGLSLQIKQAGSDVGVIIDMLNHGAKSEIFDAKGSLQFFSDIITEMKAAGLSDEATQLQKAYREAVVRMDTLGIVAKSIAGSLRSSQP